MRRSTDYMSLLYGLKVNVLNSRQTLKDIQLTQVTYWPKLKKVRITHAHGRLWNQSWV